MDNSASQSSLQKRVGVWIAGARGSVATTTFIGASAIGNHMAPRVGLVSELPEFAQTELVGFESLVFGGHDVVDTSVVKKAEALAEAGVFPARLADALEEELNDFDANIKQGYISGEEPMAFAVERIRSDIVRFQKDNDLSHVVVINLCSVEAPAADGLSTLSFKDIMSTQDEVPASVVYALAAIAAGAGFVDFTPSVATQCRSVHELASRKQVPIAGRDGKTGETLVKAALAPMFAMRNLKVRSWSGTNLLGGGDGLTLSDPNVAQSKVAAKGEVVESILGYPVTSPIHIDYIEDAGEWKTAWDHIGFQGFLDLRMTMQFTWTGCDSALAAPLVLDLARFLNLAQRRGQTGAVSSLGFFFKDPVGSRVDALGEQFQQLLAWTQDS